MHATRYWRSRGHCRSAISRPAMPRERSSPGILPEFPREVPPLPGRRDAAVHRSGNGSALERVCHGAATAWPGELVSAACVRVHALLAGADRGLRALLRTVRERLRLFQLRIAQLARARATLCR